MTSTRTSAAAAVAATLGLAATSWVVAVTHMHGMDMGVATPLGSFMPFMAIWVPMMAAMMLPGAIPAVLRHTEASGRATAALPFVGSYLAVWALAGIVVYALYRPHGTPAAGAITLAAGLYEFTRIKKVSRRLCRERACSGFEFGFCCLGSCIGLMLMQVALGVMSVTWMAVTAGLVITQKLVPERPAIDVPVALALMGLGILVLAAPSSLPALMPSM